MYEVHRIKNKSNENGQLEAEMQKRRDIEPGLFNLNVAQIIILFILV